MNVEVDKQIPPFNPYLHSGTLDVWDEAELRKAFDRAVPIDIGEPRVLGPAPIPVHSLTIGGPSGPLFANQFGTVDLSPLENTETVQEPRRLKVTKVGVLQRKGNIVQSWRSATASYASSDDLLDGGKRSTSRKWRELSVILTGQLHGVY